MNNMAEEEWGSRFVPQLLLHDWWLSEHDINALSSDQVIVTKQMYYRLSYLSQRELQFLHRKYASDARLKAVSDSELSDEYGMKATELRKWRLRILEKLRIYRDKPNG